MTKILTAIVLALCFVSGAAKAATLDITLGPTVTYFYNAGQNLSPSNIVLTPQPAFLNLVTNSEVVPEGVSLTNHYTAPAGITGPSFLVVEGLNAALNATLEGEALFTLTGNNQFGFTWGTVDAYNILTLNDGGHTFAITGADILGHIPGPDAGVSQTNVEFTDTFGNLLSAELQSTNNSFEVGNFSSTSSSTPLPASLLLFGTGLLGLFWIAYRRRTAKA